MPQTGYEVTQPPAAVVRAGRPPKPVYWADEGNESGALVGWAGSVQPVLFLGNPAAASVLIPVGQPSCLVVTTQDMALNDYNETAVTFVDCNTGALVSSLWDPKEPQTITNIPCPPGWSCHVVSLNNHGVVAGNAWNPAAGVQVGWIYDPRSMTFSTLAPLHPASDVTVRTMTDDGVVLGSAVNASGKSVPVKWRMGALGPATPLPLPAGYDAGEATDGSDTLACGSLQRTGSSITDAFVWNSFGAVRIPDPQDRDPARPMTALSVSGYSSYYGPLWGQVVVGSYRDTTGSGQSYVYDSNAYGGQSQNLHCRLVPAERSAWTRIAALGVNAQGQIVGIGYDTVGRQHAVSLSAGSLCATVTPCDGRIGSGLSFEAFAPQHPGAIAFALPTLNTTPFSLPLSPTAVLGIWPDAVTSAFLANPALSLALLDGNGAGQTSPLPLPATLSPFSLLVQLLVYDQSTASFACSNTPVTVQVRR